MRTPKTHPRFQPGPARDRIDSFTEKGAREIARRIRNAWEGLGWAVDVRVERLPSVEVDDGRSIAHFTVRSDLVNGAARRRIGSSEYGHSRVLPQD